MSENLKEDGISEIIEAIRPILKKHDMPMVFLAYRNRHNIYVMNYDEIDDTKTSNFMIYECYENLVDSALGHIRSKLMDRGIQDERYKVDENE